MITEGVPGFDQAEAKGPCRETIQSMLRIKADHHDRRASAYKILLAQFADLSPEDESLVYDLIGDAIWRDR